MQAGGQRFEPAYLHHTKVEIGGHPESFAASCMEGSVRNLPGSLTTEWLGSNAIATKFAELHLMYFRKVKLLRAYGGCLGVGRR